MDETLYCVVWAWRGEVRVFLVGDVRSEEEAANDVRYWVGEGGTITATEVDWGVERLNSLKVFDCKHNLARLMPL